LYCCGALKFTRAVFEENLNLVRGCFLGECERRRLKNLGEQRHLRDYMSDRRKESTKREVPIGLCKALVSVKQEGQEMFLKG